MLKKISAGRVESDEGFSLEIAGLELILYIENNKIHRIDFDYDPSKRKMHIYVSKLKNTNIVERDRMIKNITKAMNILKENFEIV